MGVRRLFSWGGQKISRGGKNLILHKKTMKKILFFSKKSKNIQFLAGLGRPGGQEPPCPPLRTPMGWSEKPRGEAKDVEVDVLKM
jgi:hypothetical protein